MPISYENCPLGHPRRHKRLKLATLLIPGTILVCMSCPFWFWAQFSRQRATYNYSTHDSPLKLAFHPVLRAPWRKFSR
jgi:hypothetical protein